MQRRHACTRRHVPHLERLVARRRHDAPPVRKHRNAPNLHIKARSRGPVSPAPRSALMRRPQVIAGSDVKIVIEKGGSVDLITAHLPRPLLWLSAGLETPHPQVLPASVRTTISNKGTGTGIGSYAGIGPILIIARVRVKRLRGVSTPPNAQDYTGKADITVNDGGKASIGVRDPRPWAQGPLPKNSKRRPMGSNSSSIATASRCMWQRTTTRPTQGHPQVTGLVSAVFKVVIAKLARMRSCQDVRLANPATDSRTSTTGAKSATLLAPPGTNKEEIRNSIRSKCTRRVAACFVKGAPVTRPWTQKCGVENVRPVLTSFPSPQPIPALASAK